MGTVEDVCWSGRWNTVGKGMVGVSHSSGSRSKQAEISRLAVNIGLYGFRVCYHADRPASGTNMEGGERRERETARGGGVYS